MRKMDARSEPACGKTVIGDVRWQSCPAPSGTVLALGNGRRSRTSSPIPPITRISRACNRWLEWESNHNFLHRVRIVDCVAENDHRVLLLLAPHCRCRYDAGAAFLGRFDLPSNDGYKILYFRNLHQ
jgi:hypothetical protein